MMNTHTNTHTINPPLCQSVAVHLICEKNFVGTIKFDRYKREEENGSYQLIEKRISTTTYLSDVLRSIHDCCIIVVVVVLSWKCFPLNGLYKKMTRYT